MNIKILILTIFTIIGVAGCTRVSSTNNAPTPSSAATNTPSPTPTAQPTLSPPPGCEYKQVQCVAAPCNPVLVCSSPSASAKTSIKPSPSAKSEVKSYSTTNGNSTTNININSNGTSVKIEVKNGKRYAELNGKEIQLDANGCYDYDQNGTKIHSCVNN